MSKTLKLKTPIFCNRSLLPFKTPCGFPSFFHSPLTVTAQEMKICLLIFHSTWFNPRFKQRYYYANWANTRLHIDEQLKVLFKFTCATSILSYKMTESYISTIFWKSKSVLRWCKTLSLNGLKNWWWEKISQFISRRSSNCHNDVNLSNLPSHVKIT